MIRTVKGRAQIYFCIKCFSFSIVVLYCIVFQLWFYCWVSIASAALSYNVIPQACQFSSFNQTIDRNVIVDIVSHPLYMKLNC